MNSTMTIGPNELRHRMVDAVVRAGYAYTDRVEEAMRKVPRHAFVPEASLEKAYANESVTLKPGAPDGLPLSCASMPSIVAMMLDQLDVHPGHRVLEIGAGTGYNAALLAELVGETGQVTSIDIYPDVVEHARARLSATGYQRVTVLERDGALGAPNAAPFDRIIVTVGPWDIPSAWITQLAPGGRLVVPLTWRGQARSVEFVRDGYTLRSDSVRLCGFIPMVGQDGERNAAIDSGGLATLCWDVDQDINAGLLHDVLRTPRAEAWTGITVGSEEPFDGIWLRMTATDPATCRLAVDQAAIDQGLVTVAITSRTPALADGDSLAYFTYRREPGGEEPRYELGAIGHGPEAQALADRFCEHIRAWNPYRQAEPIITIYPANAPARPENPAPTIAKKLTQLAIEY